MPDFFPPVSADTIRCADTLHRITKFVSGTRRVKKKKNVGSLSLMAEIDDRTIRLRMTVKINVRVCLLRKK